MVKRIGTDWGLNIRMVVTLFLLACVYLAFMGAMYVFGIRNIVFVVLIAGILLGAQYYFSDKLILLSLGAREVSEQEAPQLHDMIGRLAALTGIAKPKVALIDSSVPNALATGRNAAHSVVAVTTGILETLDAEELEAVLAHELSHVIHRDMRVMAMASFFATVASFIVQGSLWGGFGGDGDRDDRDRGSSFIVIFLISIAVWAVSFVLIRALSRYREYSADRGSAIITGQPSKLASALVKISGRMERIPKADLRQIEAGNTLMFFPALTRGSVSELFSTHPSLEHRLAKLQEMEANLAR